MLENETRRIDGCSCEAMNTLGCGFKEKPSERALERELELPQISSGQQKQCPLFSRDAQVDTLILDLIVFNQMIVDRPVMPTIGQIQAAQMLSDLAATELPLGFLINSKKTTVEFTKTSPLLADDLSPRPQNSKSQSIGKHNPSHPSCS